MSCKGVGFRGRAHFVAHADGKYGKGLWSSKLYLSVCDASLVPWLWQTHSICPHGTAALSVLQLTHLLRMRRAEPVIGRQPLCWQSSLCTALYGACCTAAHCLFNGHCLHGLWFCGQRYPFHHRIGTRRGVTHFITGLEHDEALFVQMCFSALATCTWRYAEVLSISSAAWDYLRDAVTGGCWQTPVQGIVLLQHPG